MTLLSVHLFDTFLVTRDDEPVAGLEAGKVQELFSYLLLHRDRRHLREKLATLLWRDSSPAQSKKYLRQVLWQLQSALEEPGAPSDQQVLLVDADSVRLNQQARLWLDVAELERAYSALQGVATRDLTAERVGAAAQAVELYAGDLLDGWYQGWCIDQRERLAAMHLTVLDRIVDWCEVQRDYTAGLRYGERILERDRARERTHRQLMRLHYLAGDRTAALHQYERCAAALEAELGVKPSRRTVALYEQIRADRLAKDGVPAPASAPGAHRAVDWLLLLRRLKRLGTLLTDTQRELQQEIQYVEQLVKDTE